MNISTRPTTSQPDTPRFEIRVRGPSTSTRPSQQGHVYLARLRDAKAHVETDIEPGWKTEEAGRTLRSAPGDFLVWGGRANGQRIRQWGRLGADGTITEMDGDQALAAFDSHLDSLTEHFRRRVRLTGEEDLSDAARIQAALGVPGDYDDSVARHLAAVLRRLEADTTVVKHPRLLDEESTRNLIQGADGEPGTASAEQILDARRAFASGATPLADSPSALLAENWGIGRRLKLEDGSTLVEYGDRLWTPEQVTDVDGFPQHVIGLGPGEEDPYHLFSVAVSRGWIDHALSATTVQDLLVSKRTDDPMKGALRRLLSPKALRKWIQSSEKSEREAAVRLMCFLTPELTDDAPPEHARGQVQASPAFTR